MSLVLTSCRDSLHLFRDVRHIPEGANILPLACACQWGLPALPLLWGLGESVHMLSNFMMSYFLSSALASSVDFVKKVVEIL